MAVLFGAWPVAVAVFEVNAKVLDGLALELAQHALVDLFGQAPRQANGLREDLRAGSIFFERPAGRHPQLARDVGFELVRAAVNRVHRLAPAGFARVAFRKSPIGLGDEVAQPRHGWTCWRGMSSCLFLPRAEQPAEHHELS